MEADLSLEFLRVVEQAAIACAHTMGQGDRHKSDQVAVEAMRKVMDTVPIDGTIVIGEGERDDAPVHENLKAIAGSLGRSVEDLVVIVLDRPRHDTLVADIRATGARIRLIGDGDLSAGIAAAVVGSGVHAVMGTGGAPEGVLTAAAMRCLNGEIFARLVVSTPEHEERCRALGITDFRKVYRARVHDMVTIIIIAATGV